MSYKILICGDSFSSDWFATESNIGWVNLLKKDFQIKNISQAGVSEYKIYLQLISENLSKYDKILVCHTSPYRIPIESHPIHINDKIHYNCDLIYSDAKFHKKNKIMKIATDFYENIFYKEYFEFTHDLIIDKILKLNQNIINITFFDYYNNDKIINFSELYKKNKGNINHLNENGNLEVYKIIKKILK
jgi:hypothetical protein